MLGMIFFVITLPFRILFWMIKVVAEIVEHSGRTSRRRSGKRRPAPPSRTRKKQRVQSTSTNIPRSIEKPLMQAVGIARDKRRKVEVRLQTYTGAFHIVDQIRSTVKKDEMHFVQLLEDGLLKEYRSLVQTNTVVSGSVSIGPGTPTTRTAADARREGVQGMQWSAGDDACPLCKFLDGKVISNNHPDFSRFIPPLHDGCKCIRVYILDDEEGVEFD